MILWQRWKLMLQPVHTKLCHSVEHLYHWDDEWRWLPSWGEW
jgi:hypothetical protein